MNQEIRPKIAEAGPLAENELARAPENPGEYRPLLLRRDLIAMLPYLNRTEFCRRPGWDHAREVDCGFTQATATSPVK